MLVTEDESITHIYNFHDKDSGKLVWKKPESKEDIEWIVQGNKATPWT